MLLALAVEFVDEAIDSGVHIFLYILGVQIAATDVHCRFCAVSQFFDGEHDMYVQRLIEMSVKSTYFFVDVVAHGICNIDVMTA
jgi:hypothetical protein